MENVCCSTKIKTSTSFVQHCTAIPTSNWWKLELFSSTLLEVRGKINGERIKISHFHTRFYGNLSVAKGPICLHVEISTCVLWIWICRTHETYIVHICRTFMYVRKNENKKWLIIDQEFSHGHLRSRLNKLLFKQHFSNNQEALITTSFCLLNKSWGNVVWLWK